MSGEAPLVPDPDVPHPGGGDLLVQGARLPAGGARPGAGGERCDVRVAAGRIVEVGETLAPGGEPLLDARGLCVAPGLVDVHVHFRDPGLARKEGWETGSAGALHGGVTTLLEVQNNPPLSTSRAALEERHAHVRARSRVDFGLYANLLAGATGELDAMAPLTPAFKLFLGGSTGLSGVADRATLAELIAAAARAGRPIVAHCEDETLLREGWRGHPDATAAEHHLVRSSEAEIESVRAAIELAARAGAALHVFHVSTAGAVELVRAARVRGEPVRASTAPHYLLLSCQDAPRLGNRMKVNPSIKTAADSEALFAGLADGTIDAIGTDHAPHPLEEKEKPYRDAPSGMPSVDLLWPLVWELARRGRLALETALASVGERAAASVGVPRKGRLAPGFDGDLVLFDPDAERAVRGASLPSRSRWSAYEGMALASYPAHVVRRGVVVLRDGALVPEAGPAGGEPIALPAPRPRTS